MVFPTCWPSPGHRVSYLHLRPSIWMPNNKVCGNDAFSLRGRHMTSCCCLGEDSDTQRLCLSAPFWPVSRWPHFQKSHLWRLSHEINTNLVCKRHICARGDRFETTGVCLEAPASANVNQACNDLTTAPGGPRLFAVSRTCLRAEF